MRSFIGALVNKAPIPYVGRPQSFALPFMGRSNSESQMRAMGAVGTLFAIVHRTSNSTAQVNWNLWRKSESGLKEDRQQVTRHAALDLWDRPNPFMYRQEFVETFQQHIDLTGEGWWLVGKSSTFPGAGPLELWPVRPDRMEPVPHPTDFLAGYVYNGPDGEKVPFDTDEVVLLRMPNPLDPYRGMGPVQAILTDLDSTKYSAEWNKNFFLNSAEPGGIIEVPEVLGDTEFNQLRDRWDEQHRGVTNAHRVAILEHGKWVDRKFTMRDMQFAELRAVSREIIREAFGIHGHMLGLSENINRANAEAADTTFARWLVVERLERIKGALNNELLPMFGTTAQGLEFDYEDPVPENEELNAQLLTARANAAKALRDAGWDPDDVLVAVGLPEMRFGGGQNAQVPIGS